MRHLYAIVAPGSGDADAMQALWEGHRVLRHCELGGWQDIELAEDGSLVCATCTICKAALVLEPSTTAGPAIGFQFLGEAGPQELV